MSLCWTRAEIVPIWNLFVVGELGSACRALQCAASAGRICESRLKFGGSPLRVILLQKQIAELFAGRNNRPRGNEEFFDPVLLIGCLTQKRDSFLVFAAGFSGPRHNFAEQNVDLSGPIIILSLIGRCVGLIAGCAKLHFDLPQSLGFRLSFCDVSTPA